MSRKRGTDMHRLVFSLDGPSFEMLRIEVLEELGAYELEDLAAKYGRAPRCPRRDQCNFGRGLFDAPLESK